MRAAVYYRNRDIRIEERPRPSARPGEIVVRIESSGVCGSDVMEWYRVPKAPVVLGHEIAGEVAEVGERVEAFGVGDRVVATHHVPCEACRYCRAGHHPYCDTLRTTKFDPGGFCEYVRVPALQTARGTFRLPDGVSYEAATFVEPLACVLRGLRVAGFRPGQDVAVLGCGISGALFLMALRALGAGRIMGTDVHPWRLARAKEWGADHALDAREDVPGRVREILDGRGAELVVVTAAATPAVSQALLSAGRGGTVLLFAPVAPGITFPLPLFDVWKEGLTIVHSYAGPPDDMAAALELIASDRVAVVGTVTHRFPLEGTQEAFRLVEDAGESLKILVEPGR